MPIQRPWRLCRCGRPSPACEITRATKRAASRMRIPRARPLLWAAMAAYATGFTALSVLRHEAFETGRFDLGNMVQAVWSTAHGHLLQVTNLHGAQISRLAAHVDPILIVFAPLWWIWPSPDVLLVAQSAAIALGGLPVFWLARKHLGSPRAPISHHRQALFLGCARCFWRAGLAAISSLIWYTEIPRGLRFSASKLRLPSAFSPLPCDLCLLSFMVQSIVDTQRE